MKWNKISISSDKAFEKGKMSLQSQFSDIFDTIGNPDNAALFIKNPNGKIVEIYISPEAAKHSMNLLNKYSSIESKKPAKENLYLYLGQPNALNVL